MISVGDADALLSQHVRSTRTERVGLAAACGRVLRVQVTAERDYPPFDRVTMDGIAIAYDAGRPPHFRIQGVQRAGEAPQRLQGTDACIEVMTGAVLPLGCDTVIRKEDVQGDGAGVVVTEGVVLQQGQNIHRRGADRPAGSPVLDAGTVLRPPHVAVLATEGRARVDVAARPRVAIVTTGDELVAVGAAVQQHQIRTSNGPALHAALAQAGATIVSATHAPDDEAALRARIAAGLDAADVLVLSGGVSMGRFDLVPALLTEAGVRAVFHHVAQRPGKPLWFGTTATGQAVFGLPGNPVSALVCLYRYVLPFLAAMEGASRVPRTLPLVERPAGNSTLTRFVPVRMDGAAATLLPWNGSGDFLALVPSDGFVEVAPEASEATPAPFFPWSPA